ncbi:WS/DGAT domain-containing protein [Mycobacterium sp.]
MNVAVSSVAGPRERGHFGGAPVSEIYSTRVLSPGGGDRCNQCGVQGIT